MTDSSPPPAAVDSISIGHVFSESYAEFFANLRYFPRAFAVPLLIMLPIGWGHWQLLIGAPDGSPEQFDFRVQAMSFGLQLLSLIPYTLFAVSWLRLLLQVPGAAPPPVFPPIRTRHLRYLGFMVVILAGSVVATLGFALLFSVLALVAGVPGAVDVSAGDGVPSPSATGLLIVTGLGYGLAAAYVGLRLSFVFPASAADEAYGWWQSWQHTRGQGLRYLIAAVLTLLPAVLAGLICYLVLVSALGVAGVASFVVIAVAGVALGYLLHALSLAVMAVCFRTCTGWVPGPTPGTPTVPNPTDHPFE